MTTQTVNIELPDDIYQRFKGVAAVTRQSLEDVIFQTIQGNLPPMLDDLPARQRGLVADLQHLDDGDLWTVVKEPLPAQQWRRHQHLLRKVATGTLTSTEGAELAGLREAADRFVSRRSYALALLKWRGHTIPATL